MSRMGYIGVLAATCAGAGFAGAAAAAEWNVNEEASQVKFSALQQGSRFDGVFEEFEATIDFDPASPESGRIVGVVQTASANTRDHDRDATLQDPDWFDTANHPEARFESQSIEQIGEGEFVANGDLTIKGKTNPAELRFTFESANGGAQFLGTMTVNRFDYNVGEGWNDTSWISQDVDVEVDLDLAK